MPLNDINNRLYNMDAKKPSSDTVENVPQENNAQSQTFAPVSEAWKGENEEFHLESKHRAKKIIMAVSALLFLVVCVSGFIAFKKNSFQDERVSLSFEGPAEVRGGEEVKYLIKIRNDNRVKLSNIELTLNYSENFRPAQSDENPLQIINTQNSKLTIGEIGPKKEKQVFVSGKFYAPQDQVVYIKAKMKYKPGSYTAQYEVENQIGVVTVSASIFTEVTAPLSASDGDPVAYVIEYQNSGADVFTNARIQVSYPEGFNFESSDITPTDGNNIWDVGDLSPGKKGKITVSGNLSGLQDESKAIRVSIGTVGTDGGLITYNVTERRTSIMLPKLAVFLSAANLENGSVDFGKEIKYVVRLKNNDANAMRDLIVRLEIKSNVLDFSRINAEEGGYYDGEKNSIVWKYSEIPKLAFLASGAETSVSVSVPVVENVPVSGRGDKNFIIASVAKADTPSILDAKGSNKVVSSATMQTKLNTKIIYSVKGSRSDTGIDSFGPLPLELGKETSYVIRWEITNFSNDVSEAKVVGTIPSGVTWTGKIYPSGENIKFDSRKSSVVWDIGKIPAGKGVLDEKKSVGFQVSIKPQVNQSGEAITLSNQSVFTAKDDFTGKNIIVEGAGKTTNLPEDPTIDNDSYVFIAK